VGASHGLVSAGKIRLRNAYDLLSLDHLALDWRLLEDGVVAKSGVLDAVLDVPPGGTREVVLSFASTELRKDTERLVEIRPGPAYGYRSAFRSTMWVTPMPPQLVLQSQQSWISPVERQM
jgi:hypothetical protein